MYILLLYLLSLKKRARPLFSKKQAPAPKSQALVVKYKYANSYIITERLSCIFFVLSNQTSAGCENFDKIFVLVEECETLYGLRIVHNGKVSLHALK